MQSGPRLKTYLESLWGRDKGGMTALADKAGVRRQTLYEWFRPGSTTEPSLASLTEIARVVGKRRVDLVAAMDGQGSPPDTTKEPPPWWEAAQAGMVAEIQANREIIQAFVQEQASSTRGLVTDELRQMMDEALEQIQRSTQPVEGPAPNGGSPNAGAHGRRPARR